MLLQFVLPFKCSSRQVSLSRDFLQFPPKGFSCVSVPSYLQSSSGLTAPSSASYRTVLLRLTGQYFSALPDSTSAPYRTVLQRLTGQYFSALPDSTSAPYRTVIRRLTGQYFSACLGESRCLFGRARAFHVRFELITTIFICLLE
jgi:hypothetical protein